MISIKSTGSFNNTERFLNRINRGELFKSLHKYGQKGVDALSDATPIDSGLAASSWEYKIIRRRGTYTIQWSNTDVESGALVVILIQYGHGTGTGGYVRGRDFINPAIQPIFDEIANDVWMEVSRA